MIISDIYYSLESGVMETTRTEDKGKNIVGGLLVLCAARMIRMNHQLPGSADMLLSMQPAHHPQIATAFGEA